MTLTLTDAQTLTGTEQWAKVRAALPVPVILAPHLVVSHKARRAVHLLALRDIIRAGRVIVGLDVPPQIIAAESCFCASGGELRDLSFDVAAARAEQDLYPMPSCSRCLRFCASITGLPVDRIKAASGTAAPG